MPIKLRINGKSEMLHESLNLLTFLIQKELDPESVVVEHNMEIIPKNHYADITLRDNDRLEILRFVGGG